LNIDDESVFEHLKRFTFLPLLKIEELKKEFEVNPGARLAQKTLALAVTGIVHGEEVATAVQTVSEILFGANTVENISDTSKEILLQNAPTSRANEGALLIDLLVETKLATSKREARTFIESGAVTINGEKVESIEQTFSKEKLINDLAILRRGKKQLHILEIEL